MNIEYEIIICQTPYVISLCPRKYIKEMEENKEYYICSRAQQSH